MYVKNLATLHYLLLVRYSNRADPVEKEAPLPKQHYRPIVCRTCGAHAHGHAHGDTVLIVSHVARRGQCMPLPAALP